MSNNLFTLKNARDFVSRFVDSGACNSTTVNARVNEACRRLMVKADWPHTTQQVRIRVDRHQFPLPRECQKIIWANICNNSAFVFNQSYEFMDSGPGEVIHRASQSSGLKNLVDAGVFPTMYDMPAIESFATDGGPMERTLGTGLKLIALSTEMDDAGKEVFVAGRNEYLNDTGVASGTTFSPGENIKINRWAGGVEGTITGNWTDLQLSTLNYREISSWKKPVTKGYVSLYAVDTTNNYVYLLAKAHPDDEVPYWRRFKVDGLYCENDHANILALVKMRALEMTRDDDILPIQNLDAIKNMVMAIGLENVKDLAGAVQYEANATRLLTEQKADHEVTGGVPVIVDVLAELTPGGGYNGKIL